ncbi:MAG: molybdenum cofactor biosynthesis protein MoaE [Bacteroidota bacterium]
MKKHKVFLEGAISTTFIAESIAKHSSKTNIGAHAIFLGQVREDLLDGKKVRAIQYTCYQEMAEEKLHEIREATFAQHDLECMHIYHSLGEVKIGEICLFVFVSSKHRTASFEACEELVEKIKKDVPIWGKEILEDETQQWKTNH